MPVMTKGFVLSALFFLLAGLMGRAQTSETEGPLVSGRQHRAADTATWNSHPSAAGESGLRPRPRPHHLLAKDSGIFACDSVRGRSHDGGGANLRLVRETH